MRIVEREHFFRGEDVEPLLVAPPREERLERDDAERCAPEQTAPWWFDQQLW